jgi:hypothetical protein
MNAEHVIFWLKIPTNQGEFLLTLADMYRYGAIVYEFHSGYQYNLTFLG